MHRCEHERRAASDYDSGSGSGSVVSSESDDERDADASYDYARARTRTRARARMRAPASAFLDNVALAALIFSLIALGAAAYVYSEMAALRAPAGTAGSASLVYASMLHMRSGAAHLAALADADGRQLPVVGASCYCCDAQTVGAISDGACVLVECTLCATNVTLSVEARGRECFALVAHTVGAPTGRRSGWAQRVAEDFARERHSHARAAENAAVK